MPRHSRPLLLLLVLLVNLAALSQTTPTASHVVVVALENQSYSDVVGSASMPYFNGLISQYGLATQFYANDHGSLSNYFQVTTGQQITLDNAFAAPASVDNIVRLLQGAGKTWKAYADALPSTGYTGGDAEPYVKHHNPFAYFTDVLNSSTQANNIVPFSNFASDVSANTLPSFSFVIPSNIHNGHDCPDGTQNCSNSTKLAAADHWLHTYIDPVLTSGALGSDGLLVIWFDEGNLADSTKGGGRIAVVLAGPKVKSGFQSSTFYRHEHLFRTIIEALGLSAFPGSSVYVSSMAEFFTSLPGSGTLKGVITNISTGAPISGAQVTYTGGSTTSDKSGNYTLANVAPGTYTLTAGASGYFKRSYSVTVSTNSTTTTDFALATGGKVAGTVLTGSGAPLSGVSVTISGGTIATTVIINTNSSGAYNSNYVPVGNYTVSISPSGLSPQTKTATVTTGMTTTVNFTAQ